MNRALFMLILAAPAAVLPPILRAAPTAPPGTPSSAPATASIASTMPAAPAAVAPPALTERRFSRGGGSSSRNLPSDYEILNRKSIFSKDRISRVDRSERRPLREYTTRAHLPPVFIGTVLEDDGYVGFIEDPNTGQLMQIRVGEKLPDDIGTVAGISLNDLEVSTGSAESPHRIEVGQNLLGALPSSPPAVENSAPAAEGAAATSAPAASGAVDDVIERLRRRRQQELGK